MLKKRQKILLICLTAGVILTGCAASREQMSPQTGVNSGTGAAVSDEMERSAQADSVEQVAANMKTPVANAGNKMIRNVTMEMESKDFSKTTTDLNRLASEKGGYVERSFVSGNIKSRTAKSAEYVFRIPAENLDSFLENSREIFSVISENISATDVSGSYYDTEARLKTLRIQQDRLNELLKEAAGLEDIILLNERLTEVEYQIESLAGSLKSWDNQIAYSTVSIYVTGLSDLDTGRVETTFGERVRTAWSNSLSTLQEVAETAALLFVFLLPFLLIVIIILVLIIVIRRANKKRKKK